MSQLKQKKVPINVWTLVNPLPTLATNCPNASNKVPPKAWNGVVPTPFPIKFRKINKKKCLEKFGFGQKPPCPL